MLQYLFSENLNRKDESSLARTIMSVSIVNHLVATIILCFVENEKRGEYSEEKDAAKYRRTVGTAKRRSSPNVMAFLNI